MIATILTEVFDETQRAYDKFGHQYTLTDLEWNAILGEEVGEVAMHVTKTCVPPATNPELTHIELRKELLQVAAVAIRWIDTLGK